jgi:lipopolysaccharide export LptBFGC system permease protein LptF
MVHGNRRGSIMIAFISAITVGLGVAVACMGSRYPRRQSILETLGGFLLIAGFGLLGYLLEFMSSQF